MGADRSRHFILRPLAKSDIPAIARWMSDLDDLAAFERNHRVPLSPEAVETTWTGILGNEGGNGKYWFAIDHPETGPVGMVGLENLSPINGDAILPIYVDRATRSTGVGLRAVALVLDIAFDQLGLARVTSFYRADNEATRTVTERIGFTREGCLRQAWYTRGRRFDMILVGILREDWARGRAELAGALDRDTRVHFGSAGGTAWVWPPDVAAEARS